MKGYVRIGGALALGIVIISGALVVQRNSSTEALAGQVVISDVPNREYVGSKDANGNGVPDWKEDNLFTTIDVSTSTPEDVGAYTPPTTLTGRFSEAFFKDYLNGKMSGEEFKDPTIFAEKAVQAIDANTRSKRHIRPELTIIPDSDNALHDYGNQVIEITVIASASPELSHENEALILQNALAENDPSQLEKLRPIHTAYSQIIEETLLMEVPESLVDSHIRLLNIYEAILFDIEAMQAAFSDPLLALARIRIYQDDAKNILSTFQSIWTLLDEKGVVYSNDEQGALFYLLDT